VGPERHERPTTDLYFFGAGYCGTQPLGDAELNVCAMIRADVTRKPEDVFTLHPALLRHSRHWLRVTNMVTTAPLVFHMPQPEYDGVLRVGDAAAFIDPFVGDGISMALRSGVLAGDVLNGGVGNQNTSGLCGAAVL
jgi:flavin-dependent dehydrogenase